MKSNIIHLIWLAQTVCAILLYYNFFTNTTVTCNSRNSKLTKTPITYIRNIYIYIYVIINNWQVSCPRLNHCLIYFISDFS